MGWLTIENIKQFFRNRPTPRLAALATHALHGRIAERLPLHEGAASLGTDVVKGFWIGADAPWQ
jgi:hypothetical protein